MTWISRLKKAKDKKGFTQEDRELARLWVTCPISEVADRIELKRCDIKYGPVDMYLLLDGLYFTKGVEEDNVDLAQNCYDSIHKQVEAIENGTDRISDMKRFLGEDDRGKRYG